MEKYVDLTPIANSLLYGSVYKFWLRQLVTVFAPFALLTIINLKTILQLKKHLTPKSSLRTDNDYRARRSLGKTQVRSATRSLLFLCLLYLLSNLPNVIISSIEFIDMEKLQTAYLDLYLFVTDLISFLVVCACALRLPIYLACNAEIRQLVQKSFFSFAHKSSFKLGSLLKSPDRSLHDEIHSFEQFL
ncbi:hypothetical protein WR25_03869 isoform D [Diploscapter pachys]|uniref:G-protein coupled receptors family 1 profile domain-containing protein n=1 Tax=Diploscapter pachys TaxID=2018661 RepID=A0A2A2JMN0_9BILA|nr:hypothetical protein WR25_03869 isoform A [Diploscapter pachys]PAV62972.1 hypothetical protein WR25_03869 isoform B [Diploscapter pachys]PAV62973.1 hypothetical protein WR25_03869 isoform C [Diploscapter pachys]PAV62974.1 hypothetical protein WR25_03869 isoform D [Diploscapter pachys]